MYSDDEYRPTYQDHGSAEPFRNFEPPTHVAEFRPVRKKRNGAGIAALVLCAALLGGVVGGGASWAVATRVGGPVVKETTIQVSGRTPESGDASSVALIGGNRTSLTEKQIYAANVDSVVSINVTGESTNVFGQRVPTASSGSGFLLTTDGYVITNYHVIDGGNAVKVTLYDGTEHDAKIIGGDEDYDIAVLKIEGEGFQAVTLGDSSQLSVGDHVAAIGNPLGELTFSMSEGIASSVDRAINVDGTPFNMIQVTCAINPGNSGGPLFNSYGEVVGIVSAKYSSYASTSVEGLGFAIPINDVLSMVEDIMTNGYVTNKPYLGIVPGSLTRQMAANYQFSITSGVIVYSVEEGSAAAQAGLRRDDVIVKVDDTEVKTVEDLNAAKKKYSAGDHATLSVYRDGETIQVEITWGSVPPEQLQPQQQEEPTQPQQGGGRSDDGLYGGYGGYPFGGGSLFDWFFNNGFGAFGG